MKSLLVILVFIGLKLWELFSFTVIKPLSFLFSPNEDFNNWPPIITITLGALGMLILASLFMAEVGLIMSVIIGALSPDYTIWESIRIFFSDQKLETSPFIAFFSLLMAFPGQIFIAMAIVNRKKIYTHFKDIVKDNWKKANKIVNGRRK